MTTHEELGAMIREARLEKSMSLGQLASAIGRSSSSVRRWERGEVMPAVSVLPKLAAILEIDPDEFKAVTSSASDTDVDGRVSTMEQPIIDDVGHPDPGSDDSSPQVAGTESGLLADAWRALTSGGRGWMGWLRGLLTAGILVLMLMVALWAVGELFDALGAVLDSFDVGSNGTQDP
jgi:transcriptional regulator with XRE-family HTH domain